MAVMPIMEFSTIDEIVRNGKSADSDIFDNFTPPIYNVWKKQAMLQELQATRRGHG
jgi:hypothetical protein